MKKPYIQQQKNQPLNITVDGKPYSYTPGNSRPVNISISYKSVQQSQDKKIASIDRNNKELEQMVRKMYGEKIVWI